MENLFFSQKLPTFYLEHREIKLKTESIIFISIPVYFHARFFRL